MLQNFRAEECLKFVSHKTNFYIVINFLLCAFSTLPDTVLELLRNAMINVAWLLAKLLADTNVFLEVF